MNLFVLESCLPRFLHVIISPISAINWTLSRLSLKHHDTLCILSVVTEKSRRWSLSVSGTRHMFSGWQGKGTRKFFSPRLPSGLLLVKRILAWSAERMHVLPAGCGAAYESQCEPDPAFLACPLPPSFDCFCSYRAISLCEYSSVSDCQWKDRCGGIATNEIY